MNPRLAIVLLSVGLASWLVACTDSNSPDTTYVCDVYFGSDSTQSTPDEMQSFVAADGNGATVACEKSTALQQQAMNDTGSDKVDCVCMSAD